MRSATPPRNSRDNTPAQRARLRAEGLRPVQMWLPDVRSPGFAAQALRQSQLVAASEKGKDDQAFIDAISVDPAD